MSKEMGLGTMLSPPCFRFFEACLSLVDGEDEDSMHLKSLNASSYRLNFSSRSFNSLPNSWKPILALLNILQSSTSVDLHLGQNQRTPLLSVMMSATLPLRPAHFTRMNTLQREVVTICMYKKNSQCTLLVR
ncbi:uncharacterized protein LOC118745687 [Rhagoletis pomonella]|uniref:uncharacterized protein LOC118745687 n=1 Tax=Rhagoletis pomonella TaxID=28610 RepID=UPI001782F9CC|nr:uncharacterized protein LOC118745687 [Rhagoletis pomonella]